MGEPRSDLTRTVLAVLFVCGLILASLWIVFPFLGAIIWATTIVVTTWPLLLALQKRLWGKRGLAVAVLSATLLLLVFGPFLAAVAALVGNADVFVEKAKAISALDVPATPPDWLARIPLVGAKAAAQWEKAAGREVKELAAMAAPFAGKVASWFAAKVGGIGVALLHFLLTVVVCAVFWANGEAAAESVRRFARRLAGEQGEGAVRLAGQAVRGVALGVVVTAVLQSLLAGLGLLIAGVPFVPVLTVAAFILCIAQVGPILVLAPAVGWLYWSGSPGWGTFLLVWTIVVGAMDNFVRPVLIRRGADLPLLLVFTGVLGGLMSLGLIGIFVGPVVLAVAHTLLGNWIRAGTDEEAAENA